MHPMRIIFHLTATYLKQLKRKWRSLSLLLLFPLLFISLLAFIAIELMTPVSDAPIEIGLVGLDHSKESRMIVAMLKNNKDFKETLHINELSEQEAKKEIKSDRLSAYITFPESFSNKLYRGESIKLIITGNPNERTEAEIVRTFMDSAAKHINSAQANILTIGEYANKAGLSKDDQRSLLQSEFKKYLFFTLAKDQAMTEELVFDSASASTVLYYVLSGIYASWLIWLILFWQFFQSNDDPGIENRILLCGIQFIDMIIAKIAAVILTVLAPAAAILLILPIAFDTALTLPDYVSALITYLLIGISFLLSLGLIDFIIHSRKLRLVTHSVWLILLLLISGAAIPLSFFPEKLSRLSDSLFITAGLQNLQSIAITYAGSFRVSILLLTTLGLSCAHYALSAWKEQLD